MEGGKRKRGGIWVRVHCDEKRENIVQKRRREKKEGEEEMNKEKMR